MFMISNFKLHKRSFKDMNIVKICFDSMHSQFEKEMGIKWRQRFNKPSPRNKRDYGPENVSWRNRIRERKRQTGASERKNKLESGSSEALLKHTLILQSHQSCLYFFYPSHLSSAVSCFFTDP